MLDSLLPMDLTPETEVNNRISTLKVQMAQAGIDGVFLTHRPDYYYFSGTAQDAWLYVALDHEPLLFVKRYLPRAVTESPLTNIVPVRSVTEIPQIIKDSHGKFGKKLAIAFDLVPVKDFKFYQSLFFGTEFLDATPLVSACRAVKSEYEISKMEEVAGISNQVFEFISTHLTPGVRETDFAGQIEAYARTLGHSGRIQMRHYRSEGFSFHMMSGETGGLPGALDSPVCGSGVCTAYPFGAGPKKIRENEPVLVDFATMAGGYHIDESRMFVVGKMDSLAEETSQASIEILSRIKEAMTPGTPIKNIYQSAVTLAGKMGHSDQFLGLPKAKSKFIGHGVGVELVEYPILSKDGIGELTPGMVFAVEPKFIFKDKFATGVESVVQVTEKGSRFLSQTPNTVFRL
ncbi:MAG: Xaa-Pro peptidase family protein [Desulfobacterales bacterium]|nr:Xaa-Pro peptidase family protein [Desulfobacterales bacterium]